MNETSKNNHILLKYMPQEYVKCFMDGILYMNTLGYYWDDYKIDEAKKQKNKIIQQFKDINPSINKDNLLINMNSNDFVFGQNDLFEGVCATVRDVSFSSGNNYTKYTDISSTDVSLRSEGYRYCNVQCYYQLDYCYEGNIISWQTSDLMNDFGDYVLIILDEREFLNRIYHAVKKAGYKYLCGKVKYVEPKKNGKRVDLKHYAIVKMGEQTVDIGLFSGDKRFKLINKDCFNKISSLDWQNEWRIAIYRGIKDETAYRLELDKDLRDIVKAVKTTELNFELEKIFSNGLLKPLSSYRWVGNIDRKDMREKFYALGEGKVTAWGVLGGQMGLGMHRS